MKKNIFYIILVICVCVSSCKEKDDDNVLDLLGLSLKEGTINSEAQSIKVTTKDDQWDIYGVGINNDFYTLTDSVITIISKSSFKTDWFLVDIDKGNKSLTITFDENNGEKRNMMLAFRTLGYHDQLSITQNGK